MSRRKVSNTLHSYDRAIERAGLTRSEAKRLMKMASGFRQSIESEVKPGPIKDFLLRKTMNGKRIKLLEGYVFVFCKTSTRCLTMYKLDENVRKAQELYDAGYLVEYCPKCKKYFYYEREEQNPGFHSDEDMVCPYCQNVIKTSLEYEFYTREI